MKRATVMLMLATVFFMGVSAAAAETNENAFATAPGLAAARPAPAVAAPDHRTTRPAMLPALYASYGALQAWDACSTSAAVRNGAREANPVTVRLAGSPAKMIALKAATTAGTFFFVERIWKQNRTAAVVVMAVINGATTAIAMNNMRNARRGR
jgi:hypothetical protein